ncbi:hypothetical protein MK489_15335 [Myxococcota bacterium]|nr:hypothetical protein [Myxococcota bacterium]
MAAKTTEHLKLDRRLLNRRGWIDKAELERALDELPDSAHNIHREGDVASSSEEPSAPKDPSETGPFG